MDNGRYVLLICNFPLCAHNYTLIQICIISLWRSSNPTKYKHTAKFSKLEFVLICFLLIRKAPILPRNATCAKILLCAINISHTTSQGKNDFCMLISLILATTFHNNKIVAIILGLYNNTL